VAAGFAYRDDYPTPLLLGNPRKWPASRTWAHTVCHALPGVQHRTPAALRGAFKHTFGVWASAGWGWPVVRAETIGLSAPDEHYDNLIWW